MKLSMLLPLAAATLVGLVVLDGSLTASAREQRAASGLLEPLVPEEARRTVAAITIDFPGRGEFLYARVRGHWRCIQAFGAPAQGDRIAELVNAVFDARGVLRAEGTYDETTYGMTPQTRVGIRFHGPGVKSQPDKDVIATFQVGTSFTGGRHGRAFVRDVVSGRVLEVDHNPLLPCTWPASDALPPMLDRRMLAGAWQEAVSDFQRIFIDFEGGEGLELRQAPLADGSGIQWLVKDSAGERPVLPFRIAGYLTYLVRAPYSGLAGADQREHLGHVSPRATVTLVPGGGAPLRLTVGSPTNGSVFVWNEAASLLCHTSPELAVLLSPDAEMLCDQERLNPWEVWLSR